jgi:hypothetical protein
MSKEHQNLSRAVKYGRQLLAKNKTFVSPNSEDNIKSLYRATFELSFDSEHDLAFQLCKRVVNRAIKGERYAVQACLEAAAKFIADGRVLPPPLAIFISAHLQSGAKVGGEKGRHPRGNLMRDMIIANGIMNVKTLFGIFPTRNADRSESKHSGCSIFVGLLAEKNIGFHISEAGVERIWKKRKDGFRVLSFEEP